MNRCAIFHLKLLQSKDVNAIGSIHKTDQRCSLLSSSEGNVHLLELVKSSQYTGSSNSSQDVGSSSGCHHHAPPDGVDGVGHQASRDGHSPPEKEGKSDTSISSEKERLECVVEAKVHATVDEDSNGRDDEASVQTLDAIGLQSLDIDVNKSIELSLTSLALGIISQPGSGVVKRVDKQERQSSSKSSTGNVGSKLQSLRSILGSLEHALDLILEGKVQSLSGEVSQHIGKISSPEGVDSLGLENPGGAVNDPSIRFVKTSLLDHLILVLDQELDSLNGGSSSLGDSSSDSGEHEVLSESQLLLVRHLRVMISKGPLVEVNQAILAWSSLNW